MSNIFTVSFFGHSWISDLNFIDREISKIVKQVIKDNNYVEFLVGRNCDFDITVSKIINRNQSSSSNISHICVLPLPKEVYNDENYQFYSQYNDIEITYDSIEISPKTALQIRNVNMVNRSNLCVFFVNKHEGATWQTLKYAISQNKNIINVADFCTEYNYSPSWCIR